MEDGPRNGPVAVVLASAAGATDAFAFLQLSGIFTANMTGNLVLAGLVDRPGYASSIVGIAVAVTVFAGALLLAFRAVPHGAGPARLAVLPTVGLGAQLAVLVGWMLDPSPAARPLPLLIALSTIAMATQTALARRVETVSGVTTTFVTGTLTSLVADLADRRPQPVAIRLGVIGALVCGAVADALLVRRDPALGAALPVLPTAVAATLLWARVRRHGA